MSPSFVILNSERDVAREAVELMKSCIQSRTDMNYIGAANFQGETGNSLPQEVIEARKQVKSAWSLAMARQLTVRRWIRLLSPHDYANRSPEAQKKYRDWITFPMLTEATW